MGRCAGAPPATISSERHGNGSRVLHLFLPDACGASGMDDQSVPCIQNPYRQRLGASAVGDGLVALAHRQQLGFDAVALAPPTTSSAVACPHGWLRCPATANARARGYDPLLAHRQ
eukprot:366344-Chlamydomonas_euryale.AAC.13